MSIFFFSRPSSSSSSWWYFAANISGIGLYFFRGIAIEGWFWWRAIQYSHLSTECCFVHDSTAPHCTHPPFPKPVQIHLHPLMISAKNCRHHMRQGGGLIWIKLDRRVDSALKVSRPFLLRWQGVVGGGGTAWDCQRGLFESGRIFEAKE